MYVCRDGRVIHHYGGARTKMIELNFAIKLYSLVSEFRLKFGAMHVGH